MDEDKKKEDGWFSQEEETSGPWGCQILRGNNGFIIDFMNGNPPAVAEQDYDYECDSSNFQFALRQAFLIAMTHFAGEDQGRTRMEINIIDSKTKKIIDDTEEE